MVGPVANTMIPKVCDVVLKKLVTGFEINVVTNRS